MNKINTPSKPTVAKIGNFYTHKGYIMILTVVHGLYALVGIDDGQPWRVSNTLDNMFTSVDGEWIEIAPNTKFEITVNIK